MIGVLVVIFVCLYLCGLLLFTGASSFIDNFPAYSDKITHLIKDVLAHLKLPLIDVKQYVAGIDWDNIFQSRPDHVAGVGDDRHVHQFHRQHAAGPAAADVHAGGKSADGRAHRPHPVPGPGGGPAVHGRRHRMPDPALPFHQDPDERGHGGHGGADPGRGARRFHHFLRPAGFLPELHPDLRLAARAPLSRC